MTHHETVKQDIAKRLNGKTEVVGKYGRADVVTKTELIEVSNTIRYKESLGRLITFKSDPQFEKLVPHLYVYDEDDQTLGGFEKKMEEISGICKEHEIRLSFKLTDQYFLFWSRLRSPSPPTNLCPCDPCLCDPCACS